MFVWKILAVSLLAVYTSVYAGVTITNPSGNTVWTVGQTVQITWAANANDPNFSIQLSFPDGTSLIPSSNTSAGNLSYTMYLGSNVMPGMDSVMFYDVKNPLLMIDMSPQFTILPAPTGSILAAPSSSTPLASAMMTTETMPGMGSMTDAPMTMPSTTMPSSTSTPPPTGKKNNHAGAIAGGVVGGVVFIAIVLALVAFFLRRRRRTTAPSSAFADHKRSGSTGAESVGEKSTQPPASADSRTTFAGAGSTPFSVPNMLYDPQNPSTWPTQEYNVLRSNTTGGRS